MGEKQAIVNQRKLGKSIRGISQTLVIANITIWTVLKRFMWLCIVVYGTMFWWATPIWLAQYMWLAEFTFVLIVGGYSTDQQQVNKSSNTPLWWPHGCVSFWKSPLQMKKIVSPQGPFHRSFNHITDVMYYCVHCICFFSTAVFKIKNEIWIPDWACFTRKEMHSTHLRGLRDTQCALMRHTEVNTVFFLVFLYLFESSTETLRAKK